jgi:hypothetical protein
MKLNELATRVDKLSSQLDEMISLFETTTTRIEQLEARILELQGNPSRSVKSTGLVYKVISVPKTGIPPQGITYMRTLKMAKDPNRITHEEAVELVRSNFAAFKTVQTVDRMVTYYRKRLVEMGCLEILEGTLD